MIWWLKRLLVMCNDDSVFCLMEEICLSEKSVNVFEILKRLIFFFLVILCILFYIFEIFVCGNRFSGLMWEMVLWVWEMVFLRFLMDNGGRLKVCVVIFDVLLIVFSKFEVELIVEFLLMIFLCFNFLLSLMR